MKTVFILIMLFAGAIFAQEISIEQTPAKIMKGEEFKLVFTIKSEVLSIPYISFNHGKIKILKKKINFVEISPKGRQWTFVYTMTCPNSGNFIISNIKIELEAKSIRRPTIPIYVLAQKPRPKDFFTVAIPSKKSLFAGEGLDVNYYIYSRTRLLTKDIERFPKLNGLIKRVNKVKAFSREEKVEYDGVIYNRQVEYSVRLYSQRPKRVILDRMGFKIGYVPSTLTFNSRRTKVIWSKKVPVVIKPLPTINVPPSFTGLVGDHKFKLVVSNRYFLINNPFEVQLWVEGEGALEVLEAPVIYDDAGLEAYDTDSQILKIDKQTSRKVFTYTYLGRRQLDLGAKVVSLSYFNPDIGKYQSFKLQIPPISIVEKLPGEKKRPAKSFESRKAAISGVIAPQFHQSAAMKVIRSSWIDLLNFILGAILVFTLLSFIPKKRSRKHKIDKKLLKICREIRKKGPDYNRLHTLLSNLSDGLSVTYDRSLMRAVESSQLSLEVKQYFKELIIISEKVSYGNDKVDNYFVYKGDYFNKLLAYIKDLQNLENENNPLN